MGNKIFVIAEAGKPQWVSQKALKLVDIASKAGADAVKFQLFKVEKIFLLSLKNRLCKKKF